MKIQLVNPIKELEKVYKREVEFFINIGLITLDEWNNKFKNYRDEYGYSIIHYLKCVINKLDAFLTLNPIMLKNKKELEGRFGVKIISS